MAAGASDKHCKQAKNVATDERLSNNHDHIVWYKKGIAMNVKTINSEQIWQSSDGQRTIWEVTLKADDDKEYKLKTYSSKISQMGFEGEVRSYVNPRGERFVR